jgi:hypothetical protein
MDTLLKLSRRAGGFLLRRLAPWRRPRLRLDSGGAFIAIVGGDDAGRWTAVSALHGWLARDLEMVKLQLPRPARRLPAKSAQEASRQGEGEVRGFAKRAREVMQARDRYRAYLRARRRALRGALVICDGFPIPRLGSKDSPAGTRSLDESSPGGLVRHLARLEALYFDRILYPDVLIVLRTSPGPEVAGSEETWREALREMPGCVLDAARPQEDVLADIKRCVWSSL